MMINLLFSVTILLRKVKSQQCSELQVPSVTAQWGFPGEGKDSPHMGCMTLRLQDFTVTRCLEEQIRE